MTWHFLNRILHYPAVAEYQPEILAALKVDIQQPPANVGCNIKCHVIIIIFQVETVKSEQMEEDVLVLLPVADFVNFVQNHKKVINPN